MSLSEPYNLHSFLPTHSNIHSPPSRPPPCYPHSRVELQSPHEGPLNLTMNNSGNGSASNHSPLQSRPSVITCTTLPDRRYDTSSNGSSSPCRKEATTGTENYHKIMAVISLNFLGSSCTKWFKNSRLYLSLLCHYSYIIDSYLTLLELSHLSPKKIIHH